VMVVTRYSLFVDGSTTKTLLSSPTISITSSAGGSGFFFLRPNLRFLTFGCFSRLWERALL